MQGVLSLGCRRKASLCVLELGDCCSMLDGAPPG
jgi:hypothetical protein